MVRTAIHGLGHISPRRLEVVVADELLVLLVRSVQSSGLKELGGTGHLAHCSHHGVALVFEAKRLVERKSTQVSHAVLRTAATDGLLRNFVTIRSIISSTVLTLQYRFLF